MKKVLFTFVGEQDPASDKTKEEGSIVTLCRHIKPDYVYLFPTAKGPGIKSHTEDRARGTEEWIKELVDKNIEVYIEPIKFNPVFYEEILEKTRQVLRDVINDLDKMDEEYEIHINCSSGTPQLKTSWIILTYGRHIPNPKLYQVLNPQFAEPDKRIELIKVDFLEENAILNRIEEYCTIGAFSSIKLEAKRLENISIYSQQKQKAEILSEIFSGYENWDLIKYKEANDKLFKVINRYNNCKDMADLMEILEKQYEYLKNLNKANGMETEYNIVDLYYNALRRFERKDYTDTLARFWRIYEGSLYYYLRKKYGIEPTNLTASTNRDSYNRIKESNITGNNSLSIYNSDKALEEIFKDNKFIHFKNSEITVKRSESQQKLKAAKILDELRNKRNNSIVAHGMKPVSETDAENAVILSKELLEKVVLSDRNMIEEYPFKTDICMNVINNLLR